MKSRGTGGSRKNMEAISEELHQLVFDAVQSERTIMLIALIRHFGLGKKRLNQFIKTFNDTEVEFKRYEVDEVYDDKVSEEFERIGVKPNEIFPQKMPFKLLQRREKLSHETRVEYAEAKRIHDQMVKLSKFAGGKSNDRNNKKV